MGYSDGSMTSDTVSIFMTFTLSSTRLLSCQATGCGYEQVFFLRLLHAVKLRQQARREKG
jgi:hypothetical protein